MNRIVVATDRSRSAARGSTRRSGAGAEVNREDFGLTSDTPRETGGHQ